MFAVDAVHALKRSRREPMPTLDLALYGVHVAFWAAFGLTRLIVGSHNREDTAGAARPPIVDQKKAAPYSRALVWFHGLAFGVLYLGVDIAVIPGHVPVWFPGQRIAGTVVIAGGAALMAWALASFRSWRVRAQLDEGHQLATGGPFRFSRHPIYMGFNLLALGTALWVPTAIVWAAVLLIAAGGDLRARAEEALLEAVFGTTYREYCARTWRFVPGFY